MVNTKIHMRAWRPRKSLDNAYPAVVITDMLTSVPSTVRTIEISMEPVKFEFLNVFS
ncbi:hypothetical protein D3C87_1560320 [compost metagenome]